MRSLVIGLGEIGMSLFRVISKVYPLTTYGKDLESAQVDCPVDVMHVCLRYGPSFLDTVQEYIEIYQPKLVINHSTVPIGTTRQIEGAVHSPNRGLHPNLETSIQTFTKHIGGERAAAAADYFRTLSIKTRCHPVPEITEAQHILSNTIYGVGSVLAQELADFCRNHNLDYHEVVMEYTQTHNEGYRAMGMESKIRPIVYPPFGPILGHCVVQNVKLIPDEERTPLMKRLAEFNG